MDTSQVRKKINSRTKAIMPASLCGCAVELEEVWQIASEHKLFVVEDVAQGLFSKYQGKFMGTKSDAGCFSMATSKLIWTGQGGLVVTQNNELSRHLRLIRSHGVESALDATPYLRMGFNFKFSEFHALIGLVQMQRVQERINSLKAIYQKYREALLEMDWIKLIPVHVENGEIPLYVEILVEEREKLMGYLESRNIQTRRIYPDLDSARHLGCHEDFPNARVFAKQGMVLPCGPDQPKEDVERVLETLKLYSRLK